MAEIGQRDTEIERLRMRETIRNREGEGRVPGQ